jgi:four helix bundle protein
MAPLTVQDLQIWQDSVAFVKSVQGTIRHWTSPELDAVTAQVLAVSVSIPVGLADARRRDNPLQARRFAQRAIESAFELDALLMLAAELDRDVAEEITVLRQQLAMVQRRIGSFISCQEWKIRYHACADRL